MPPFGPTPVTGELHQCLNTEAHEPHDFCPGLDAAQVADARALTVACSDCLAPAGTPCRGNHDRPHLERRRLADLRALEQGTCGLCGRWMVRGTVLDAPVDAWHPVDADAAACPVFPDARTDWIKYAAMVNLGMTPGHPGVEHFRPELDPDACCPECRQGKHVNCTLTVPLEGLELTPCPCMIAGHPGDPR